ncbi:MAG: MBL fold metallo-hydrolase [Sphaerochaetaceae bacterium]
MINYSVLGSGSNGNAYAFCFNGKTILIDSGFSRIELIRRFEKSGLDFSTVCAVFVTHLHPDHCKGLGVLARKDKLPIYVNQTTYEYCQSEYAKLGIPEDCRVIFEIGEIIQIGDFEISSFRTSHDSTGSVGYTIRIDDKEFCLVTDTGVYSDEMVENAKKSNVLFLESNYDETMLKDGPYPYFLKQRVAGERGHLSNKQAVDFLKNCDVVCDKGEVITLEESSKIEKVYLIHLSKVNNNAQHLQETYNSKVTVCENGQLVKGNLV